MRQGTCGEDVQPCSVRPVGGRSERWLSPRSARVSQWRQALPSEADRGAARGVTEVTSSAGFAGSTSCAAVTCEPDRRGRCDRGGQLADRAAPHGGCSRSAKRGRRLRPMVRRRRRRGRRSTRPRIGGCRCRRAGSREIRSAEVVSTNNCRSSTRDPRPSRNHSSRSARPSTVPAPNSPPCKRPSPRGRSCTDSLGMSGRVAAKRALLDIDRP